MIHKLPKWVEVGGFVLAFNAGLINVIGLLGFKHQAVSHLTGTSTFLALAIANVQLAEVLHLLLVMLSFVLGAAFSGALIGNVALKLGRRYSWALLTESVLLMAAMYLLSRGSTEGHFLASAACGLQNAMTSTYSGAVVRTTHVSGLFTDMGVALGLRLRGQRADRRKMWLYLIIISGFVSGGVVGAVLFVHLRFTALAIPSAITLLMAIMYWAYWHTKVKGTKAHLG